MLRGCQRGLTDCHSGLETGLPQQELMCWEAVQGGAGGFGWAEAGPSVVGSALGLLGQLWWGMGGILEAGSVRGDRGVSGCNRLCFMMPWLLAV